MYPTSGRPTTSSSVQSRTVVATPSGVSAHVSVTPATYVRIAHRICKSLSTNEFISYQEPALANSIQLLPTRILDDWMRQRPTTSPVLPDDLNSFTLVALRTLLKRAVDNGRAGAAEQELLVLLAAPGPYELWMNRQELRDALRRLAEEIEGSGSSASSDESGSVGSESSSCGPDFAPFAPALRDMLEVNETQRWEAHRRRAEGSLEEMNGDGRTILRMYGEYMNAFNGLFDSASTQGAERSGSWIGD